MPPAPSIAVVLEGGLVQRVIVEDWPGDIPFPRVAIVDYDTEGAFDDELTRFPFGGGTTEAVCRVEIPVVYGRPHLALSPTAVLAALNQSGDY